MLSDRWPAIKVRRFDNEPDDEYRLRSAEIVTIIDGFRHGRYQGELAELLDERLEGLQSGIIDARSPSPLLQYQPRPRRVPMPERAFALHAV
ncbi:MAG: hypothetical protein EOP22_01975 [Hyphomicrobiales bacterium]|nr:MAG: hypothetical protein EOP22_01975 [Hyphomicrobiales bacterium]